MSDQEQPAREPEEGESKGPSRPPPTSGPPPMTATRARLLASRGQAPAQPAPQPEPTSLPPDQGPESLAEPEVPSNEAGQPNVPSVSPARRPPAPPSPVAHPVGDSTSDAASVGTEAATPPPARPEPPFEGEGAAPARPAGAGAAPPRPAAAPPPPAEPEEVVGLREMLPDLQWKHVQDYLELNVPKARLLEVSQRLRDEFEYDYLSSVTAVDWRDRIEMVYHLYSFNYFKRQSAVVLRVDLERPDYPDYPLCPSLTKLWAGAGFQEREVYDLMGVKFVGHADLRRILLADDFPGHPLRKDFEFDYEYVLVRHLSYGVEGQFKTPTYGSRSLP